MGVFSAKSKGYRLTFCLEIRIFKISIFSSKRKGYRLSFCLEIRIFKMGIFSAKRKGYNNNNNNNNNFEYLNWIDTSTYEKLLSMCVQYKLKSAT